MGTHHYNLVFAVLSAKRSVIRTRSGHEQMTSWVQAVRLLDADAVAINVDRSYSVTLLCLRCFYWDCVAEAC